MSGNEWRGINDFYFVRKKAEEKEPEPVDINEESSADEKEEPEVKLLEGKWLPSEDGFQFNKKCIAQVKAEFLKETIRKRVIIDTFVEYEGETEDLGQQVEASLDNEGIGEAEITLFYGDKYSEVLRSDPSAICHYKFKAHHNACEKDIESEKLEMPQQKMCRSPVLIFTDSYTKVNAYNLALFATLAYSDDETIRRYFNEFDNVNSRTFNIGNEKIKAGPFFETVNEEEKFIVDEENIFSDDETDTQFFIASSSKQILIAIRGTEPGRIKDWFQDTKADEVDFSEGSGQVHKGFYECFLFVREKIDEIFKVQSGKEIIITGHSLGGAIATILAAYIRENITDKVMLYTYGSPRVGDKTFAHYFTRIKKFICFRCVNDKDLVTNIPLPGMELNAYCIPFIKLPFYVLPLDLDGDLYTHIGKKVLVHILNHEHAVIIPDYKKKYSVLTALQSIPTNTSITIGMVMTAWESIQDHFMHHYFRYLSKDLYKSCKLYGQSGDYDLEMLDNEIILLQKEIDELEETNTQLQTLAKNHKILAEEKKDDSFLSAYHAKEAANVKYKVAELNYIIADRKVDLSNYRETAKYYQKNKEEKTSILRALNGSVDIDKSTEKEIAYHSNF